MITLDPKLFVSYLYGAFDVIFWLGFYCGISIGLFISLWIYCIYKPQKPIIERVSTSDALEE